MSPRFIPFRKRAIIELCVQDGGLDAGQQEAFRRFCHLLESAFHFEFHQKLEQLKDLYSPIDPDRDTVPVFPAGPSVETDTFYFLLTGAPVTSPKELDERIESWLSDRLGKTIDFEIGDALDKLARFGLVTIENDVYKVPSPDNAHDILDDRWDANFEGNSWKN